MTGTNCFGFSLEPHPSVTCDGCRQPIGRGIRYACTECHNFDLCEPCFRTTDWTGRTDTTHDLAHGMLALRSSRTQMAIAELQRARNTHAAGIPRGGGGGGYRPMDYSSTQYGAREFARATAEPRPPWDATMGLGMMVQQSAPSFDERWPGGSSGRE